MIGDEPKLKLSTLKESIDASLAIASVPLSDLSQIRSFF